MPKFATGRRALGRCQRCGDKKKRSQLRPDGEQPQLLVCETCRDIKHPTRKPFNTDEGIMLKRPAPDTDDDSPGDSGIDVTDTLFPGEHVFGGGT